MVSDVRESVQIQALLAEIGSKMGMQIWIPRGDCAAVVGAPEERRSKVFQEIRRPVFSLLDRGPLSESCTFITYDSVRQLATQPHLVHLSDSVLEEYEEEAEE